ncbi:MAG TPA: hypothetical protein DIS90_08675 [Cytophagales bacterium]|nr:hypothetical protein [Cytophagales bacterium]
MVDFDRLLQYEITERESIMFEIERALFTGRYDLSSKHQNIFWAHSISMLYSVWEGFVQNGFKLYVDELNSYNLNIFEFCPKIVIHHMENSFKQLLDYPSKEGAKMKLYQNLKNFYLASNDPIQRIINTESNVGFNVINTLLQRFGLESFPEHWDKYAYPNTNLKESLALFLKLRNEVSHGSVSYSSVIIDQNGYNRFKHLVRDLMYEIRKKMMDGLNSQAYKGQVQLSAADNAS